MRKIKISELFTIIKGKSLYTKTYGSNNYGEYPVFSASNHAPLTYINHYDFDGKYMTWATNGFAGYIKIIDGKFSINGDRGIMIPKYEKISIDYVKFALEPLLRELAKGRRGDNNENEFTKVYPRMVENTAIDFPIDEEGIIDEEKQQELVESYLVIEELKQKIADYQKKLEQLTITVEQGEHTTKEVRLFDVFDSFAGKSTYTKAFVEKNKGEYPIYSANTTDGGLFGMVNFFDFDTECIQITTNGAKAGTIFYRDHHKFSINGDAKVLIKKHDTIDYKYALYILQQVFIDQKFSWENKPSQAKLAELTFHIPILPDGSFDLTTQHQIAQTYETIAQIKSQMLAKMQELQDVQVIV